MIGVPWIVRGLRRSRPANFKSRILGCRELWARVIMAWNCGCGGLEGYGFLPLNEFLELEYWRIFSRPWRRAVDLCC